METTFDKFINSDSAEREQFDKEYADFALSEFILEKMEQANLSTVTLDRKAGKNIAVKKISHSKN